MTDNARPIAGPRDQMRLKRDDATGLEAVAARFHSHAYDMHFHDEWLVGVTHAGVQDFFCRGRRRQSTPGRVILIEPGERHDGQAVAADGFAYNMLYMPQALIRDAMGGNDAHIGFSQTLADDEELFHAVARACEAIFLEAPRLMIEDCRDRVTNHLFRHLSPHMGHDAAEKAPAPHPVAARTMDYLRARFDEEFGLDELAEAVGAADRFQLSRGFRRAYGTSPHACLVQLRLAEARRLLREKVPPAEAAALSGFADQSHMGRWFRRAYGMTPAAYRRGRTNVPEIAAAKG